MAKRPTRYRETAAERIGNRRRAWIIFGTLGLAFAGLGVLFTGILSPRRVEEEHPHVPPIHGGTLVSVGDDHDHYHVEVVLAKNGILRLYPLAADAAKVVELEVQTPTARLRAAGSADLVVMKLRAVPQADDQAGKTSQFVGRLPWSLRSKSLTVTVPDLTFAGKRFAVEFDIQGDKLASSMPAYRHDEDKLLKTPGGKYTPEDIEANGTAAASQKFKDLKPRHHEPPMPGDPICPVTGAKATPALTWIVGGKSYQFCCPPCIGEFVVLAKELPEEIEGPETYVQMK